MRLHEELPIFVAIAMAAVAALESSGAATRQEFRGFFATVLEPQTAGIDSDPGYMNGVATAPEWLPAAANAPDGHE